MARYRDRFFGAAGITADDRVLDIGCGTGHTTRDAARLACSGSALGVDLSARMIERASLRAAEDGLDNASFLQADAQIHAFEPDDFDVAISRTGAMFFGDPVAAFINIRRALRPAGRLSLLTWREMSGNHWFLEFSGALLAGRERSRPPIDAPGPFSLADPERVTTILTAAGFSDVNLEAADELMYFGADADDAFRFVHGQGFVAFMLAGLDKSARAGALDALRSSIDAYDTGQGVLYPSAAWVISARA